MIKPDKNVIWVFFIMRLLTQVVPVTVSVAIINFIAIVVKDDIGIYTPYIKLSWIIPILLIIINFIWSKLTYNSYEYCLDEESIKKESGIIFKNSVVIPYKKIQNIVITRGVLDRYFGLADLHVETAGGSGSGTNGVLGAGLYGLSSLDPGVLLEVSTAEAVIVGMPKDEADKLRAEILKRSGKQS